MDKKTKYKISDYTTYLYRFYSDIRLAKDSHYYKLINELWHYQPVDLYEYSKKILEYVEETVELIVVFDTFFGLKGCPDDVLEHSKITKSVVQMLVSKYIGNEYKLYDSHINRTEMLGRLYSSDSRIFYRALENLNYCFISGETNFSNLCAVQLTEKVEFDEYNYLILEKKYADLYDKGKLRIKRNGYPYIDDKRMFEHIEIGTLKKIRRNLEEV